MIRTRSQSSNGPPVEDSVNDLGALLIDGLPRPRVSRVAGARTVGALLPSGRMAWIHLRPELAPAAEVNRMARSVAQVDARHALATRVTSLSIDRLSRMVVSDARRLTRDRLRGETKVRRRMAAGDAKLDRAISTAKAKARRVEVEDGKRLWKATRNLRRQELWNSLVLVGALPLFAAYGQKGDPLGVNNAVLAISLAVWLVGDELSDYLTGERRIQGGLLRDVDVWSYVAPFANLLTGWWLLRDQQHERFVTGLAVFRAPAPPAGVQFSVVVESSSQAVSTYVYTWVIDVAGIHVAAGHMDEFRSYSDVAAIATIRSATLKPQVRAVVGPPSATVALGFLTITVEVKAKPPVVDSILESLEVAWLVDTRAEP
jgi:hypothetical protein